MDGFGWVLQKFENLELLLRGAIIAVPLAVIVTLIILLVRHRARTLPTQHIQTKPVRAFDIGETVDITALEKRIETSLANQDNAALAPLYLALARGHGAEGNGEARLAALRSAAGYASLHGPIASHAIARVELAEAAQAAGDRTSACEQWQLARAAFLADGQMDQHAAVDKRMRDNGCPTDWVLTDF